MSASPGTAPESGRAPSVPARCPCGRDLAVPVALLGRQVRCPACGGETKAPDRAGAGLPVEDPASLAGLPCTICLGALAGGGEAVRCPACAVAYHAECWGENGGCGVFGCPVAPETAKEEEEEGPVQTAWGDSKECPQCGKEIQAIAIKCRFCRANFGTRDPITKKDWREMKRRKGAGTKTRTLAVVAFVLSAACATLPVGVGIALYHLGNRQRRSDLPDADRFLFIGAVGVGGLYLLLWGLFSAAGW